MPRTADTITTPLTSVGIDIGKEVFHVVGFGTDGKIAFRWKIKRLSLAEAFKKLPPSIVGMEACLSAHFVSRTVRALGHEPRIIPAIYVKPFVKGQKNDYNDAEAVAEAALRPNLRTVQEKNQDQLDLQAYHRVRSRLVSRRTATMNQIRAFLIEQGIAVRAGTRALRKSLFEILKHRKDEISPRMVDLIVGLYEDWLWLDERIETITGEIEQLSHSEINCRRLMSVPGIGPLNRPDTYQRLPPARLTCETQPVHTFGSDRSFQAATRNIRSAKRWGNRPGSLWIADDFGCCASG
jgi:transposase